MFVIAVAALVGLVSSVLWFTGWADEHILEQRSNQPPRSHTSR